MATSKALPTFEVDKVGLAKLLEKRGKHFAVTELVQNAWDEKSKNVEVELVKVDDNTVRLNVTDDNPEGFKDLTHAYTLFAESDKKSNPRQRGRFNLGEKLVIAIAQGARITTTKGTITFSEKGRVHSNDKTDKGSVFEGLLRMDEKEMQEALRVARTLIAPKGVKTTINGTPLPERAPVASFDVRLRTEKSDAEGYLRPTERKTRVDLYEPLDGETAGVYELGIPVVDTGDRWHVDVGQKVPLNTDRDNVPAAFLRDLRVAVVNEAYALLDKETAGAKWVDQALESDKISEAATNRVLDLRFGEKRVAYDPTDHEASKLAMAQGYTVVAG